MCLPSRQTAGDPAGGLWCAFGRPMLILQRFFLFFLWPQMWGQCIRSNCSCDIKFMREQCDCGASETERNFKWWVEDPREDRSQLVTTGFQTEMWDAIWAWGFPGLLSLKESQDIPLHNAACRWRKSRQCSFLCLFSFFFFFSLAVELFL